MALYLTDNTTVATVEAAASSPHVLAFKLYPQGATTNADSGVTQLATLYPVLEKMAECGVILCIHGEVTHAKTDIFDREKIFIDEVLLPLCARFPTLKIILEHVTTKDGIDFVLSQGQQVAATITAHHLLLNRNDLLVGGIKPHHYCLPVLKRASHQDALLAAIQSGNSKFFLGTDSAPYSKNNKESACGCAGIFTAHAAIELYAEAFESVNALDKLEAFASHYGADFYGLPRNTHKITLQKQVQNIAHNFSYGDDVLIPFRAGETIAWTASA